MLTDRSSGRIALLIVGLVLASCTPPEEQEVAWSTGSVPSHDGVSISYQVAGDGPVSLVFVHGWSCDRSYWREQLDHFAAANRVVAIDLAGHGESGMNRDDWTMAAFGEDVAAVVNELDLDQVVLVGHSMGASVVVEAEKRISDQVIGLVAVDEFLDLDQSASLTPADIEAFLAPFTDDFAGTTREFVSADMFLPGSDPDLVNWILDDVSSAPAHVGIEAGKNLFLYESGDVHQALGEIQVPIRAIHSDMKPTNVEALERYGIEVVLMSGVGHFLTMEDPETFNALISEAISDFVG